MSEFREIARASSIAVACVAVMIAVFTLAFLLGASLLVSSLGNAVWFEPPFTTARGVLAGSIAVIAISGFCAWLFEKL